MSFSAIPQPVSENVIVMYSSDSSAVIVISPSSSVYLRAFPKRFSSARAKSCSLTGMSVLSRRFMLQEIFLWKIRPVVSANFANVSSCFFMQ